MIAVKAMQALAVSDWTENHAAVAAVGGDRAVYVLAVDRGRIVQAQPPPGQRSQDPPGEWTSLGGIHTTPPALCSWGPGRLDVFGIGQDRAMYHRWWVDGAWKPEGTWHRLGGKFVGPPIAVTATPNRLDLFGLGQDRALWHKEWAGRWVPGGSDWDSLGGWFLNQPEVCSLGPGTKYNDLFVCGIGRDGHAHYLTRRGGRWDAQEGWYGAGGVFGSVPVVVGTNTSVDILGLGQDDGLYRKKMVLTSNGFKPTTGEWESLGGTFNSAPNAVDLGAGDAMVFGLGRNSSIWYRIYPFIYDGSPKGEWTSLGGQATSAPIAIPTNNRKGEVDGVEVFALGKNTGVWQKSWARSMWKPSNQPWKPEGGGWTSLGGQFLFSTPIDQQVPTTQPPDGQKPPAQDGVGTLELILTDDDLNLDPLDVAWFLWRQEIDNVFHNAGFGTGMQTTIRGLSPDPPMSWAR